MILFKLGVPCINHPAAHCGESLPSWLWLTLIYAGPGTEVGSVLRGDPLSAHQPSSQSILDSSGLHSPASLPHALNASVGAAFATLVTSRPFTGRPARAQWRLLSFYFLGKPHPKSCPGLARHRLASTQAREPERDLQLQPSSLPPGGPAPLLPPQLHTRPCLVSRAFQGCAGPRQAQPGQVPRASRALWRRPLVRNVPWADSAPACPRS